MTEEGRMANDERQRKNEDRRVGEGHRKKEERRMMMQEERRRSRSR